MKCFATAILSLSMLSTTFAQSQAQMQPGNANESAVSWLAITDSTEYDRSWEQTGEIFQEALSKDQWKVKLEKTRAPLGAVRSREFKTAKAARSLPGAPEGQYMVIQYETEFERSPKMIETVTVIQEDEGAWRVVGYFVNRAK